LRCVVSAPLCLRMWCPRPWCGWSTGGPADPLGVPAWCAVPRWIFILFAFPAFSSFSGLMLSKWAFLRGIVVSVHRGCIDEMCWEWTVGWFDWLTGNRYPDEGVPALPPEQVHAALLGNNRATAPYVVRAGDADEADLVAEWRVVDAEWRQVFADAGINKVFRVKMRLDPENQEVRAADHESSVQWKVGATGIYVHKEAFVGKKIEYSWSNLVRFTEYGEYGQAYKYRFNAGELKKPLRESVTGSGWTWRRVAFKKL